MLPLAFTFANHFGTLYPKLIIDLSDDVPGDVTHEEEPKRTIKNEKPFIKPMYKDNKPETVEWSFSTT